GDEVQQRCVEQYDAMRAACGVVVVEGTDLISPDPAADLDLNAQLARNLGTPVVAVVSGAEMTPEHAADVVDLARRTLDDAGVELLAVMVNRADPRQLDAV
ncbi:phosphate acetyltransferase, partial [Micrococcus endophyticus]